MITKVGMIILLEHDLDAAVEFYKKLGLKQVFYIKESWAEFTIGSVKLGLCPTSQEPYDRLTGIVLEVDDVKKMYEQLKDNIMFKAEPLEKVHGIMVGIQDPGGNIIDLYQPTPQKVQKLVKEVVDKEQKGECVFPQKCSCLKHGGQA
jgi:predicted enzyme related to lactoylglutathione lyase